jgi:hypothetical protein
MACVAVVTAVAEADKPGGTKRLVRGAARRLNAPAVIPLFHVRVCYAVLVLYSHGVLMKYGVLCAFVDNAP